MARLDRWQCFFPLAIVLIAVGVLRSVWATRPDGFTLDEPWHITAGVAYLRTGEYYLNPEHPPLVKLLVGLAEPQSIFHYAEPPPLNDKRQEREFVESTVYNFNDADRIHRRVRPVLYLLNGCLLLFFAITVFRLFRGVVAVGALSFALLDPTVAAHWPVVMTDLPVSVLSVTSILLLLLALRSWTALNLCLLAVSLGFTLSVKHSGIICAGFVFALGLGVLFWQFRSDWRTALKRSATLLLVLLAAGAILWSTYGFRYHETKQSDERFNRPLDQKIADVRSPLWRAGLSAFMRFHALPRSYIWGLADIVRTGMEGRADTTYAFGRLTFMERRPFLFPGYVLVKLPIPLLLIAILGGLLVFAGTEPRLNKLEISALLLFVILLFLILANSAAEYAGVRHAMAVYFVLAVFAGFALRWLVASRSPVLRLLIPVVALIVLFPALSLQRPWEYHNIFVGGTANAHRYFRNEGVELGQRDRDIADYCHRVLEPRGEVPYILFSRSLIDIDLRKYRHLQVKTFGESPNDEFPPATVSGVFLTTSQAIAPAMWSDLKALREAQPVDRIGNLFVFRGTFYLPNARADALFDRAEQLLAKPQPPLPTIEAYLKEGLLLRPSDYTGWLLLGNLYLLRGDRELATAAYKKGLPTVPAGPFRQAFDDQIHLVQTRPLSAVPPMRDPGIE